MKTAYNINLSFYNIFSFIKMNFNILKSNNNFIFSNLISTYEARSLKNK